MRRSAAFILLVLLAPRLAAATDFLFAGPAPARNFQPIQLVFLQLPFERPATVGRGIVALNLNSAESNEIATTQGGVESQLKFETNRTVVGVRYGFADGWEFGLDLPFITRYGGFLDPIIDEVEGIFGTGNPERDLYPNNRFGDFTVRRGPTVLFEDGKETFEPGDLWFSTKRELRLGERWPLLALRGAVKVPSGSETDVAGSGHADIGLGIAAEQRLWSRLAFYLNFNVVYPTGPVTPGDLTLNPMVSQSFAAELALFRRWSALLHQAVYTSPMHGTGTRLLDGTTVELGLGVNFSLRPDLALQMLAIDNVSGVEQAADFTLLLAMTARFRVKQPSPA